MNIRCSGQTYYGTADAGGPVSLYIHYPFCVRKCRYCDFLSGPADEETRQRYLTALCEEIRAKAAWLREGLPGFGRRPVSGPAGTGSGPASGLPEVDTIFFGGGTPSLMTPRQLDHLLFVLADCFQIDDDAEITLECNPGTADYAKLRDFSRIGVNRLSIGVQSFREEELRLLGRIHTAQDARQCVQDARRAGFANVSLDLISALPGQTYAQWMENLAAAAELEPEHISAYSLILEDGTPLKAAKEAGLLPDLPEEDLDRQMYHDTRTFLEQKGYHRYEISNYARPGYESRHNNGYWTGHPYLGLGLGAASYLIPCDAAESGMYPSENFAQVNSPKNQRLAAEGESAAQGTLGRRVRWSNPADLSEYLRQYAEETKTVQGGRIFTELPEDAEFLSREDQMAEFLILGLRRMQGVSEAEFAEEYGCSIEEVYGSVLNRYCGLGLLVRRGGRIAFTEHGIDVSNTVLADFLPD